MLDFTGERIVPQASNCEITFADKMFQEHLARYAFSHTWIQNKRVLDVGCGVGYGAKWMAERGASSVHAFDISEDAITHAKQFYSDFRITYSVNSAEDFSFGEKFDVVTCFELIEHVENPDSVINCISNCLGDHGVVIMSTPRALDEKRTHYHVREFSEGEFRNLFTRHFSQLHLYSENNHFCSLISNENSSEISNIHYYNTNITLEICDYFIAVASKNVNESVSTEKPVLVVNNDLYVKTLERDNTILRNEEYALKQKVAQMSEKITRWEQVEAKLLDDFALLMKEAQFLAANQNDIRYQQTLLRLLEKCHKYMSLNIAHLYLFKHAYLMGKKIRRQVLPQLISPVIKAKNTLSNLSELIVRRSTYRKTNLSNNAFDVNCSIRSQYYDVLFCIGCWDGESKRYRVFNIMEGLRELGYTVNCLPFANIIDITKLEVPPKTVVIFRAPYSQDIQVEAFLSYARTKGILVVYDIDDLVFDVSIRGDIDAYMRFNAADRISYLEGVRSYEKMMSLCDLVTVPTSYLSMYIDRLGFRTEVIPNTLNKNQINFAERYVARPLNCSDRLIIGYFSGSRTHQRDFEECSVAIKRVLNENQDLILRIVGHLELSPELAEHSRQIERFDVVESSRMMELLAECDIVLAPLDCSSKFCNAKSELKFFEAAICGIPTVASATDTYTRAIHNGIDGFIVNNKDQWYDVLSRLVASCEIRNNVGRKAREKALQSYSYLLAAKKAAHVYEIYHDNLDDCTRTCSLKPKDKNLRIAWIVPGLIIGGGGHRNILRAAYYLECFGHNISLYFTNTSDSASELKKKINDHFYNLNCSVYVYGDYILPCDVLFATHWSTVEPTLKNRSTASHLMYFVQDYEPYFYPMGSEYILAENTYRQGLYHITSGPWCKFFLERNYNAEADFFQFPVDRSVYFPKARTNNTRTLLFFAKPEMPRRCYEIGIQALKIIKENLPDLKIVLYGSRELESSYINSDFEVRSIVPTLEELAWLYSNADLGIVFSTTNPSLIPYEMMACGLPVVDLARPGNEINYGGRFDIAFLADPNPLKMAQQIVELLDDSHELENRSHKGLDFVNTFPSEEGMSRRIEELIFRKVGIN